MNNEPESQEPKIRNEAVGGLERTVVFVLSGLFLLAIVLAGLFLWNQYAEREQYTEESRTMAEKDIRKLMETLGPDIKQRRHAGNPPPAIVDLMAEHDYTIENYLKEKGYGHGSASGGVLMPETVSFRSIKSSPNSTSIEVSGNAQWLWGRVQSCSVTVTWTGDDDEPTLGEFAWRDAE
ncbi:MAG: hypothetical protein ACYTDT_00870 [Planctomycetota bacterium]|jgi:hypothetical protein